MASEKLTKMELAIHNVKAEKAKIDREILFLSREGEALNRTILMLEKLEADKLLAK